MGKANITQIKYFKYRMAPFALENCLKGHKGVFISWNHQRAQQFIPADGPHVGPPLNSNVGQEESIKMEVEDD